MDISQHDRDVLRRLAAEQAEISALPVNRERAELWRRTNQLEAVKPPVWINEVCWNELSQEIELDAQCVDPWCRGIEIGLRRLLYQWKHFPGDTVVDGRIYCAYSVIDTGFGIREESEKVFVSEGSVASRHFVPGIQDESDIEKIRRPEVTVDHEATDRRFEVMQSIFEGVIPVKKRGYPGSWFAPWDELIRWWGVQEAMMDLVVRPEMVHAAMDRLVDAYCHRLDQWEALGLLELNNNNARIGSGGFGYTDQLPQPDFDPAHVRCQDIWGSATAQIFSEVSPDMHEEFALRYERRWIDRFGLAYYGCCEPLHLKIGILSKLPNLRKISMSPWANLESAADQTQGRYVLSFKPNPAYLAKEKWDTEQIRTYLRENLEKVRGLPVEVILKDISSVGQQPRRLWEWAEVAREVTEEFA
ncbi:hypothetical protein HQ520_04480 [bacterium]|nr:hypothetical protein [bacterium]